MEKLLNGTLRFKVLTLMYFAGFTFVCMALDLFWMKTGAIPVLFMWQILGGSIALALTQFLLYEQNLFGKLSRKARVAVHFVVNYALVLSLIFLFGWEQSLSLPGLLGFSGIFIVAFTGLHFAFNIYYRVIGDRMNAQLEKFKQS